MALDKCTNWFTTICITCPVLREIVQIDLIQFVYSNYIRSICTKVMVQISGGSVELGQ
jgi:hypothetical protein